MNIIQFKYAIEVERTGSISQAAENLYMAQPNLSKAIRELEETLGFPVFERTSRGVVPTRRGEEFLKLARGVLLQVEQMEALRDDEPGNVQRLSLSMPRGSYIADGVARFIEALDAQTDMRLSIKETNSVQTVNNVLSGRFRLGIIRYRVQHEAHFLDFLDEKELTFEQVWEYDYEVLLSKAHPTGGRSTRWIRRGWRTISSSPTATRPCRTLLPCPRRRTAPETAKTAAYSSTNAPTSLKFSAASPPPTCGRRPSRGAILEQWGLVQKKCASNRRYRDVLIYPRRYTLTEYDRLFIDKLFDARNDIAFGNR